jgi:hypothetical protein
LTGARCRSLGVTALGVGLLLGLLMLSAVQPISGRPSLGGMALADSVRQTVGTPDPGNDPAPGVQTGPDAITVLAQPAWVEGSGIFRIELGISATDPSGDNLVVQGYGRLTTRTGFDDALNGQLGGDVQYLPNPVPLGSLHSDSAGGVDVEIPVNEAGGGADLPEMYAEGGSGVFPIQLSLQTTSGTQVGSPVTTFVVFAFGTAGQTGLPALSVAVVLPIHAAPALTRAGVPTTLSSSTSDSLAAVASALDEFADVPLTLAVTPQTLDALNLGPDANLATLAELSLAAHSSGDEVLPEPYAAVPINGMLSSGLGSELSLQISQGYSTLGARLGTTPTGGTWVVNGPLDASTVQALEAEGAKQLILPEGELSALPAAVQVTTFAFPSRLVGAGTTLPVYGADPGLTADFDNPGGPVLAASQLLAEMAMIQLETPSVTRGVAVLPPTSWNDNATFVRTLLAGLDGNPLLRPVTASGLFSGVSQSGVTQNLTPGGTPQTSSSAGQTAAPAPSATAAGKAVADTTAALTADANAILDARGQLQTLALVLPANLSPAQNPIPDLQRELLIAESVDVTGRQRGAILAAVGTAAAHVLDQITLPRSASITLTSTKALLPLTVLVPGSLHARIELHLSSPRLIFRPYSPAGGRCHIPTLTSEVCDMSLTTFNTTLRVPVEARSSGVFPLDVSIWTQGGGYMLTSERDTVRSTAVSDVGLVLIVLAVLSLGLWWYRDLRHGRRARQLVPPPVDPSDDPPPRPPESSPVTASLAETRPAAEPAPEPVATPVATPAAEPVGGPAGGPVVAPAAAPGPTARHLASDVPAPRVAPAPAPPRPGSRRGVTKGMAGES